MLRPDPHHQPHQEQHHRRRHPVPLGQCHGGVVGTDVLEDGTVPKVLLIRQHFGRLAGKLRRVFVALEAGTVVDAVLVRVAGTVKC